MSAASRYVCPPRVPVKIMLYFNAVYFFLYCIAQRHKTANDSIIHLNSFCSFKFIQIHSNSLISGSSAVTASAVSCPFVLHCICTAPGLMSGSTIKIHHFISFHSGSTIKIHSVHSIHLIPFTPCNQSSSSASAASGFMSGSTMVVGISSSESATALAPTPSSMRSTSANEGRSFACLDQHFYAGGKKRCVCVCVCVCGSGRRGKKEKRQEETGRDGKKQAEAGRRSRKRQKQEEQEQEGQKKKL